MEKNTGQDRITLLACNIKCYNFFQGDFPYFINTIRRTWLNPFCSNW